MNSDVNIMCMSLGVCVGVYHCVRVQASESVNVPSSPVTPVPDASERRTTVKVRVDTWVNELDVGNS